MSNELTIQMPRLTENEIHAMYMDMFNKGQNAVIQLGSPPLTLMEWRDRELTKLRSEYRDNEK